jgi:hypothetical protein
MKARTFPPLTGMLVPKLDKVCTPGVVDDVGPETKGYGALAEKIYSPAGVLSSPKPGWVRT